MKNYKLLISTLRPVASPQFLLRLQFEAEYANTVRGGHLPSYLDQQKRLHLVNDVNLLTSDETKAFINFYTAVKN